MGRPARVYGWRLSPPDFRDHVHTPAETILPEVDPRGVLPSVFDQGQLGSCTANAVAAALEYDNHLDGLAYRYHRPSRLDIYYGERALEGNLGRGDTGAYGRDGFKFAQQTGYLWESAWPYDISTYQGPPPPGTRRKLTKSYAQVAQDEMTVRATLSSNQTIAFGFTVYDSFEAGSTMSTGVVPMPKTTENVLGGHEVLAVGYLSAYPNYVLCRNSWSKFVYEGLVGADVYGGGYFLFPWSYLLNSNLAGDLRTIVRT